jgi:hypothetical protein
MNDIRVPVVPVLSKTESHDSLTLGCGIFGLGLGATIIMGNSVMHEALGTWNLAKVDVILDLTSGVLILITGFLMGRYNKNLQLMQTGTQAIWV